MCNQEAQRRRSSSTSTEVVFSHCRWFKHTIGIITSHWLTLTSVSNIEHAPDKTDKQVCVCPFHDRFAFVVVTSITKSGNSTAPTLSFSIIYVFVIRAILMARLKIPKGVRTHVHTLVNDTTISFSAQNWSMKN